MIFIVFSHVKRLFITTNTLKTKNNAYICSIKKKKHENKANYGCP